MSLPTFYSNLFYNNDIDTSNIHFKGIKGLPDTLVIGEYQIVVNSQREHPTLSVIKTCPINVINTKVFDSLSEDYYNYLLLLVKLYIIDDNEYHLYI
jgi:hypothetical protein